MPAKRAAVRNKETGEIVTIPIDRVQPALEGGLYLPVTQQEYKGAQLKAKEEAEYGGALSAAEAATVGGLREASLGISDAAAVGLAGALQGEEGKNRVREHFAKLKQYQPEATVGGQVVGAIGPLLATGGASLAAKGALTGARAASKLGSVARVLGAPVRAVDKIGAGVEAGLKAAGVSSKVATVGARGMTEGALTGVGNAISEVALSKNPELAAEHIIPHVVTGAAGGALIGGGIGGMMSLGSKFARQGTKLAPKKLAETLEEAANERAFEAMKPIMRDMKAAEKVRGGEQAIGKKLREEIAASGKKIETMSIADLAELGAKRRVHHGERLDGFLTKLDSEVPQNRPSIATVADDFGKYKATLVDKIGAENFIKETDDIAREFSRIVGRKADDGGFIKFRDLRDFRKALDKEAFPGGRMPENPTVRQQVAHDLRNVFEDRFTKSVDEAAGVVGEGFRAEYEGAKASYQAMKMAEKIAGDAVLRKGKNRLFSLTDYLSAISGQNPADSIARAVINKVLRERGNMVSAGLMGRMAKALSAEEAAAATAKTVGDDIAHFMKADLKMEAAKPMYSVPSVMVFAADSDEKREKKFNMYVDSLVKRVSDPAYQLAEHTKGLEEIQQVSPRTASIIMQKKAATDQFLASKIPAGFKSPQSGLLTVQQEPKVSKVEQAKFARYVAVAERGPTVLTNEIRRGAVNPETVEATKVIYPASFQQIQEKIMEGFAQSKKEIPFAKKVIARKVFQIPASPALRPQFMAAMQASYAPKKPKGQAGPAKAVGTKAPKVARDYATDIQRIEGGI